MSEIIRPVCPDMTGTPQFYIKNRTITPSYQYPDIVVTRDSKSRRLRFSMPRYFNGIDLSSKTLCCRYTNPDFGYDESVAMDLNVSSDTIEFTWYVPAGALVKSGVTNFDVTAMDEAGYEWHTKPYPLKVEPGLNVGDKHIEYSPDAYQQLVTETNKKLRQMETLNNETKSNAAIAKEAAEKIFIKLIRW